MKDKLIARHPAGAFSGGALIGTLGGLIGLGGAEFRLPLLIGVFQFAALEAIILNKAMSLVVVASALLFRTKTIPVDVVLQHGLVVINLLAGSLLGAWLGAGWATRLKSEVLYKLIAVLLVVIAIILIAGHFYPLPHHPALEGIALWIAGMVAGLASVSWRH